MPGIQPCLFRSLNVGAYSSGIIPPVGGFFTVSFTKVSGSVAPDVTTAGGSYSSSDALAQIP